MYKQRNSVIKKLVKLYDLGDIKLIDRFNTNNKNSYKVITDKSTYIIKEYSKDAISNYYYLKKRKEQIRINKILNLNHIPCLYPINVNNKNFIKLNDNYYLVYNYIEDQSLEQNQISIKNIKKMATTQAKIHNLNITSSLPCMYKKIAIDINKYLRKSKNIDQKLYDTLKENKEIIKKIIYKCNKCITIVKKNTVISHNKYKLNNILWNDDKMTIIEYNTIGKVNPTTTMAESAIRVSYNKEINKDYYTEYLKAYFKEINKDSDNYKEVLYASFYGLLEDLKDSLNKIGTKEKINTKDIINLINEIVDYYNSLDELTEIYFDIKKRA